MMTEETYELPNGVEIPRLGLGTWLLDDAQAAEAVEAYSPVAHGAVLGNPEVERIARSYGASAAQLCIRYCLQLGLVALPKTANPTHMAANARVDFEISADDMSRLGALTVNDYGEAGAFPVYGGKL